MGPRARHLQHRHRQRQRRQLGWHATRDPTTGSSHHRVLAKCQSKLRSLDFGFRWRVASRFITLAAAAARFTGRFGARKLHTPTPKGVSLTREGPARFFVRACASSTARFGRCFRGCSRSETAVPRSAGAFRRVQPRTERRPDAAKTARRPAAIARPGGLKARAHGGFWPGEHTRRVPSRADLPVRVAAGCRPGGPECKCCRSAAQKCAAGRGAWLAGLLFVLPADRRIKRPKRRGQCAPLEPCRLKLRLAH